MSRKPLRFALAAAGLSLIAAGAYAGQDRQGDMPAGGLDGYGLHYVDNADSAKLAYGQPNSDAVGLMLECAKGSRQVEVSDLGQPGDNGITLIANGRRSALQGSLDAGDGRPVIYATAPASTPALQGFRKTGRVEVRTAAQRYLVTAEDRAMVDQFFSACGAV